MYSAVTEQLAEKFAHHNARTIFDFYGKSDSLKQTGQYNALNFGDLECKLTAQMLLCHVDAHVTFKETLMSNLALEWITRSTDAFGKRVVIFGDNQAVVPAFTKRRSSTGALEELCQRAFAHEIVTVLHLYHC